MSRNYTLKDPNTSNATPPLAFHVFPRIFMLSIYIFLA